MSHDSFYRYTMETLELMARGEKLPSEYVKRLYFIQVEEKRKAEAEKKLRDMLEDIGD